jgi:hypothetical protein
LTTSGSEEETTPALRPREEGVSDEEAARRR